MECVFGSTFVCKTIDAARNLLLVLFKDGKCAETDDILPDGFKLKKGDGVYYMSYAMGRGCLTFGEMMQKISDLKDGSTMKRLYMLIFISGKNKNENLEMERVIEFPHTHMDRRPRKTPRLGWDIAPQALKEGATKEDIEQLPKYKFRRIGDFEKQNGEIQESFGGIIRECDTDSAIEHVFSPENATTVVLAVDVAFNDSHPHLIYHRNIDGKTTKEVFEEEHGDAMKEAKKVIKDINSCLMLVFTIIGTISYAALFTIPGGFDQ
ncbi:hypothetical protein ACSBR2_027444 [Camellia fascicularis]